MKKVIGRNRSVMGGQKNGLDNVSDVEDRQ